MISLVYFALAKLNPFPIGTDAEDGMAWAIWRGMMGSGGFEERTESSASEEGEEKREGEGEGVEKKREESLSG